MSSENSVIAAEAPAGHTVVPAQRDPAETDDVPGSEQPSTRPRPWLHAAWRVFWIWLISNGVHLAISVYARRTAGATPVRLQELLYGWYQMDATYYVRIAELGYGFTPEAPAFFPLYPMLIRAADPVLPGNAFIAAMILSNAFAFGALLLAYRLTDLEFGRRIASRTVFYLAAFPMAFYLFAPYNEGLFILLALGALYAARTGNWWLAGIVAGLCSATRTFGVLLLAPMCWEYLRQRDWQPRRIRWSVLSLGLAPLGLVAYAVYCQQTLGDPLAFSHAQDRWQRSYTWPGNALVTAVRTLNDLPVLDPSTLLTLLEVVGVLAALVLLVLSVVGPYRLRRDQAYLVIFAALPLVLMLSTQLGWGRSLQSTTRYMLELLPLFVVLARLGAREMVDRAYLLLAASLQALLLVTYVVNSAFVA